MESTDTTQAAKLCLGIFLASIFLAICLIFITSHFNHKHFNKVTPRAHTIAQAHAGLRCAKCDGKMAAGFIIDRTHSRPEMSAWIPGAPEVDQFGDLKENNAEPVVTFRCTNCGFVEAYTK